MVEQFSIPLAVIRSIPDGNSYPLLDLVICHGDFLNADHTYVHKNQSVRGFGSYGDILIRDRKMYVAPTPFGLVEGAAHTHTLILSTNEMTNEFKEVGLLTRTRVRRWLSVITLIWSVICSQAPLFLILPPVKNIGFVLGACVPTLMNPL